MRLFVVINPVAGHVDLPTLLKALDEIQRDQDWEIEAYLTTGKEELTPIVRQRCQSGVDMVAVAGGDGTIAGVASALVPSKIPLGILPSGTGNLLARALRIPLDQNAALNLLIGSHRRISIDAMQVGEKHYFLDVSAGISSRSMRLTLPEQKRRFGMLAYAWSILSIAIRSGPRKFSLTLDGKPLIVRASEVLVFNGSFSIEPPFAIGSEQSFHDHCFDVYIINGRNLYDYIQLAWKLITRQPPQNTNFHTLTVRNEVTIKSGRHKQPVQADGDVIGKTPITVRLCPDALDVLVPV